VTVSLRILLAMLAGLSGGVALALLAPYRRHPLRRHVVPLALGHALLATAGVWRAGGGRLDDQRPIWLAAAGFALTQLGLSGLAWRVLGNRVQS